MRQSYLLGAGLAVAVAGFANAAMAQSEIKIGEINSYSLLPAFTEPYRKGWQLAVEEINAAGGIKCIEHAESLVFQRRRRLGKSHRAMGSVEKHQIGEGAADINARDLSLCGFWPRNF